MLLILIPLAWMTIAAAVLAVCRMASRADSLPAGTPAGARRASADPALAEAAHGRGEALQSPRRPTTCGTVRRRILTSVQSDQLATYK
jgi:hypothetical protein